MTLLDRFTSKTGKQDAKLASEPSLPFDPCFFTTVLDMLQDAVCFVSAERRILYWNRVAEEITGYHSQEVKGRFCHDHLLGHYDPDGNALCHMECPLTETLQRGESVEKHAYLRHKDGYMVSVRLRTQVVRDELGTVIGAAEVFHILRSSDVAHAEPCTDPSLDASEDPIVLPDEVVEFIRETRANGGSAGLYFLQLDNYPGFVNRYGQMAGARLLSLVEKTLNAGYGAKGCVQHWRTDQFALALPMADKDSLARTGKRIQSMVEGTSLTWWGGRVSLTTSIGADLVAADEKLSDVARAIRTKLDCAIAAGGNRVVS